MKRARRVISHHGSDCPDGPHNVREHRCLILTRIDRPGQLSEAWVSGDCAETMPMRAKIEAPWWDPDRVEAWPKSERIYRKRHRFAAHLPTYYGGGFWERVQLGPVEDACPVCKSPRVAPIEGERLECVECGERFSPQGLTEEPQTR